MMMTMIMKLMIMMAAILMIDLSPPILYMFY